jgi:antitoxin VapB
MNTEAEVRTARLFRNGRSQAVRIPKEFELEGDEVEIRKAADGSLTLMTKGKASSWADLLASMEPLDPDDAFPQVDDYPPEPVELPDREAK